uniref:Insulin n=1 Tax=Cyclopterus lumpus TaxID=8103 RepID=A0A8C2Z3S4_CYCLU
MLCRLTLALAVVCVGGVCNCMKADLMGRLILPRDYGVKLCGREFIRAVIFTCGGSRWKRSTGDIAPWSLTEDNRSLKTGLGSSLADLLALYGVRGDRNKQKRNFSLGVAGKCCNQGCTKNDIGRLC